MPKELAKQYAPQGTEDRIYQNWCDKGYFHTQIDRSKKPFTIVMPPPNVTGQLHMGHAFDGTLQDVLTRYKRMDGYAALWLPGTDHASIATEVKVVDKLREEEGKTKQEIGREAYLERAAQCNPPLPDKELGTIWKSALKFFRNKIEGSEGYVQPDEYDNPFGSNLKPDDYSDIGEAKVLAKTCIGKLRYTSATDYIAFVGDHWDEDKQKALGVIEDFMDRQQRMMLDDDA